MPRLPKLPPDILNENQRQLYAAITGGGKLVARHVIHAASMQLGGRTTAANLRTSVAHSLRIAAERGLKTIAFPAVGTGIAGFPLDECASIMLLEAAQHLSGDTSLEKALLRVLQIQGRHRVGANGTPI